MPPRSILIFSFVKVLRLGQFLNECECKYPRHLAKNARSNPPAHASYVLVLRPETLKLSTKISSFLIVLNSFNSNLNTKNCTFTKYSTKGTPHPLPNTTESCKYSFLNQMNLLCNPNFILILFLLLCK